MKKFWTNKRVLVTGHTGFKGGWLTLWLNSLGADVWGFSLPPISKPNFFEVANVKKLCHSHFGNTQSLKAINKIINDSKPEIVFHFAAQAFVKKSYTSSLETINTNVLGSTHLLESLRDSPSLKACVIASSDKCYEISSGKNGLTESARLGGYDPYSASKAASEILAASYRRSFFDNKIIATVRSANLIGGGDWGEDRLIPDIVRSLVKQKPVTLRNPSAKRAWLHVFDSLQGYLLLAQRLYQDEGEQYASSWNFGPNPNSDSSVISVTKKAAKIWGQKNLTIKGSESKPFFENPSLKINSGKARKLLQWSPKCDVEQALSYSLDWYKAYFDHQKMGAFSLRQLQSYLDF